jgi:hypothetical protein
MDRRGGRLRAFALHIAGFGCIYGSLSGKMTHSGKKRMLQYKVAETSDVSDVALEKIINEYVSAGWALDGIHFAMRDASRRPAMAFVLFSRHNEE